MNKTSNGLSWLTVLLICALCLSLGTLAVVATKYHAQTQRYNVLVQDLQQAHDQLAEPSK